jgi:hypothetical protein
VLRAIVGDGQAPMPRPARGAGAPLSDGVPSTVSDGALSTGSTGAAGGRGGVPGRPLTGLPAAGSLDPAFDVPTQPGAPPPASGPPPVPRPPEPSAYPAYPPPPAATPHPQAFPAGLPAHLMPSRRRACRPAIRSRGRGSRRR